MNIQTLTSKQDLEKVYPLIRELRTELDFSQFMQIYEEAHKRDGYTVVAVEESGKFIGAMGYRLLFDFVHGKHVYIDDLVVTEESRSKGIGKGLLDYANEVGIREGCERLRLCTGTENEQGIRFYKRENWTLRAIVFKKLVENSQIA